MAFPTRALGVPRAASSRGASTAPRYGGGMSNYVGDALAATGGSGNPAARYVGAPAAPSSPAQFVSPGGTDSLDGTGTLQAPDHELSRIMLKQRSGQALTKPEQDRLVSRQWDENEMNRTGGKVQGPITPRPVGAYQQGQNDAQKAADYAAGRQSGLQRVPPGVAQVPATGGRVGVPSGKTAANSVLPQTPTPDETDAAPEDEEQLDEDGNPIQEDDPDSSGDYEMS